MSKFGKRDQSWWKSAQNLRNEIKTRSGDSVNFLYWGNRTNKSRRYPPLIYVEHVLWPCQLGISKNAKGGTCLEWVGQFGKEAWTQKMFWHFSDLIKSNPLRMGLSEEYAATRLDSCIRAGWEKLEEFGDVSATRCKGQGPTWSRCFNWVGSFSWFKTDGVFASCHSGDVKEPQDLWFAIHETTSTDFIKGTPPIVGYHGPRRTVNGI